MSDSGDLGDLVWDLLRGFDKRLPRFVGGRPFAVADGRDLDNLVSGWIEADNSVIRPMVDEASAKYAKEKNITRYDCKA